jgi:hypothetical protein
MIRIYEELLKCKIKELDKFSPIYTLSGGIDSSLIFSYLDNPDCFCVQVNGNEDYEYAKKLNPNTIKIEFNDIDIEKILIELQSLDNGPYLGMSDFYDYFVYCRFPNRLIIVGEEPRFENGINITKDIRKLFFLFRYSKVDSPYMYNENLYDKEIIKKLVKKRLPEFISKRRKKETGHNSIFKEEHKDQIEFLKLKYGIIENDYNIMWKKLNLAIWEKIK